MKRRTFFALGAMLALSACTGSAATASSLISSGSASAGEVHSMASSAPSALPSSSPSAGNKSLVIWFSATGNTAKVAHEILAQIDADSFEIVPEEPYTDADLDYNNDSCRANIEQNDADARPAFEGSIENLDEYDTVYLGFPIWWGTMPRIINTLLDAYDFDGKTILPFCTSGGSGISTAVNAIQSAEPNADVKSGLRLSGSAANDCASNVAAWINEAE